MENSLYSIDVAIFRWINEGWSNPAFDCFFKFITDYHHFEIPILFFLLGLLIWGGKKGRWVVLALIVTVILTDQVSASVVKPLIDRVRPCNALTGVFTPDDKPDSYSFPSSHATNMGGSMTLLALAYPPWAWLCALIAFLVGLSRVYLGVHYPSDVLSGWFLGITIGWGVWKIFGPLALRQPKPVVLATKNDRAIRSMSRKRKFKTRKRLK